MEERHVEITFSNQNSCDSITFSEIVNGTDLQALRTSIQAMQTKMNNWLTAEIEKEKKANGVQVDDTGDEDIPDDDDEPGDDDDDSEPPTKQQKT